MGKCRLWVDVAWVNVAVGICHMGICRLTRKKSPMKIPLKSLENQERHSGSRYFPIPILFTTIRSVCFFHDQKSLENP